MSVYGFESQSGKWYIDGELFTPARGELLPPGTHHLAAALGPIDLPHPDDKEQQRGKHPPQWLAISDQRGGRNVQQRQPFRSSDATRQTSLLAM